MTAQSLVPIANEVVPFPLAASWAEVGRGNKAYCPFGFEHDDGGAEPALRVYRDHGWCFAENRYLTVSSLLAAAWNMEREDAAAQALERYGWVPPDPESMWADAGRAPQPDRESLADALVTWCRARCPDWDRRQYDERTAARLARCLGLLSLVYSPAECRLWLETCQRAMRPYLS